MIDSNRYCFLTAARSAGHWIKICWIFPSLCSNKCSIYSSINDKYAFDGMLERFCLEAKNISLKKCYQQMLEEQTFWKNIKEEIKNSGKKRFSQMGCPLLFLLDHQKKSLSQTSVIAHFVHCKFAVNWMEPLTVVQWLKIATCLCLPSYN